MTMFVTAFAQAYIADCRSAAGVTDCLDAELNMS